VGLAKTVLLLFVHVDFDDLVPPTSDDSVVFSSVPDVRDLAFKGIMLVKRQNINSRDKVEHFDLASVRANN
jgi:hypothetical protein